MLLLIDFLLSSYAQVRKNKFIEILPINVGCLGACTYCKTKHARGHLGSYTVNSLVSACKSCCVVFHLIIVKKVKYKNWFTILTILV